jgi:hypothetical protein
MRDRTRRLFVVLAALALVVVAARLALDPIATWRTRRALAGLQGMDATFSDVEIKLLDLSYAIPHESPRSRACGSTRSRRRSRTTPAGRPSPPRPDRPDRTEPRAPEPRPDRE